MIQANLPNMNGKLQIQPPQIVDLAAAAVTIYDKALEPRVAKVFIHNIGQAAVKYSLNQNATATVYHDILAADTGVDQGLGTKEFFDFQAVGIDTISVLSTANPGKLSVIKFTYPL